MKIDVFKMERMQSTWENVVDYNLSESGVHPLSLKELLTPDELASLTEVELGYTQTNGTVGLREAIARLYPGISLEQILATAGSSEANFLFMWSLIEPGDEVLFELPNYMQMGGLLRAFGANVKPFRLRESLGWQPDLDEMRKLVTPKTKLIVLTNPNNPTGSVLDPEAMKGIVGLAADAGAWILADEVYQGAELSGVRTPSFWGQWEKTLVVNGLSKAYGLPGLRVGWIVGPEQVVKRTWPYHDYTTISPSALSDRLASITLSPGKRERVLERTRGILNANFPILSSWLKGHGSLFRFLPPKAGAIVFVRYALEAGSVDLVERLIRERSVLLVPGDHFETEGYLRFGYGSDRGYLEKALARIDETLKKTGQSW
jgi:aspartate/methionine/tyrosine aminotransferase